MLGCPRLENTLGVKCIFEDPSKKMTPKRNRLIYKHERYTDTPEVMSQFFTQLFSILNASAFLRHTPQI